MSGTTSSTSLSRTRSPRSPSPPPALLTQKRTLLSRLRRYPATASPSSVHDHEGRLINSSMPVSDPKWDKNSTPASSGKWDKRASRRAPPPPPPPHLIREYSLGSDTDAEVMGMKEETEWERIRTLPRVRLVPPEDEGEPILLYPPPPPKPPPVLLNAPQAPSRPPQWTSMEHTFALPTPAFTRRGRGVVMPKRRAEVVADRQRRMSRQDWDERIPPRILAEEEEHEAETETEADQSLDTVLEESESSTSSTSELFVRSEVFANEGIPPLSLLIEDVQSSVERPVIRSDTPTTIELEEPLEAGEVDLPPSRITSPSPPRRPIHQSPVASSSSPTSIFPPVRTSPTRKAPITADDLDPEQLPTFPPLTKPFKRKPRSQSLTSALAAKVHPVIPHDEEPPSVPALGPLRKQRSLKKFFFPDVDQDAIPPVPPVPDRERRSRGLLSRAKSKPSLRIDIKASRAVESAVPTPVLSASSERLPDTPPVKTPGLSKRFSLSNMSLAFKKARPASNAPVPSVPDLPDVYRKDRDGKGIIKTSAVPLGPTTSSTPTPTPNPIPEPTALSMDVQPAMQIGLMDPITLKSDVRTPQYPSLPPSPITSIEEEEDEGDDLSDELTHAQLMHISPRTRLDPAASPALQEHVGRAVAPCTVVRVESMDRRESLRGLIGLEFGISMFDGTGTLHSVAELQGGSESDSSLDTTVENEPVTPNPAAIPLSRRIDTPTHTGSPASLVAPTPTSTPRSRFPSPEAFLRKFGSPKSTKSQIATYASGRDSRDSPRSALATVIPLPPPDMSEVDSVRPFSSLAAHVQLKSLHFDSLDLDFGGFHFRRDAFSASATSS